MLTLFDDACMVLGSNPSQNALDTWHFTTIINAFITLSAT